MQHREAITESGAPRVDAKAIDILEAVQERLKDVLTATVVRGRERLLSPTDHVNSPLACDANLAEMAASICQLDQVIVALKRDLAPQGDERDDQCSGSRVSDGRGHQMFGHFSAMVAKNRLEEASRELSRIFQMPLDRAGTATRFFARAVENKSEGLAELVALQERIAFEPVADAMRLLMKTFGFQAVEARMAMETFRVQR